VEAGGANTIEVIKLKKPRLGKAKEGSLGYLSSE
jgi:hypothetical protein